MGQIKSSPVQAAPSPARWPAPGNREESYRVAGVPTPLTAPRLDFRRGPGGSAGALRRRRPLSAGGGPTRADRPPAPRKFENSLPHGALRDARPSPASSGSKVAGREGPRRLNRPSAEIAVQPHWRNRLGPGADSTRPAALNGAFRRKGEAGEGGGTGGPRAARGCGGTWEQQEDEEEVSGLGPQATPLLGLRT